MKSTPAHKASRPDTPPAGGRSPIQVLTRGVALGFCALSITVIMIARTYSYRSSTGPGPGFFPLWLGIFMLALSLIWIAQLIAERAKEDSRDRIVPPGAILPIAATLAGSFAYAFILPIAGYPISMSLYMMLLLTVISAMKPGVGAVTSIAVSLGSYYLLAYGMGIPLPRSPFALLGHLGL